MRDLFYVVLAEMREEPRAKHYLGFPPKLTGGKDERKVLPVAAIIVIQQDEDGSIFLYRYTREGSPVGDTWHPSIEEAKEQARYEFGDAVGSWHSMPGKARDIGDWLPVPNDVTDIEAYLRSRES